MSFGMLFFLYLYMFIGEICELFKFYRLIYI